MTTQKHKYFKMGTGTTYTHIGFWCPSSKKTRELLVDFSQKIEEDRPEECQFVCDHCGTSIVNHHIIQDANGEKFSVGSECIKKLNDVELSEKADSIEKAELDRIKKEERKLMDDLEREINKGHTNKEMRSILKKENEKLWIEKRKEAAKPIIDFISGISFKGEKTGVLREYTSTSFLIDFLNNPKKELNNNLKNGLIRVVEFKYTKSRFATSDISYTDKLAEFEMLYSQLETSISNINQEKIDIDTSNNKKYK